MPRETFYYAREAWREVKWRHRVYADRIHKGKMTAATASLKTQLMREVATVFLIATQQHSNLCELRFPIRETGPGPLEIEIHDLTPHIAEVRAEIRRRRLLLRRQPIDCEVLEYRLQLLCEMLEILQTIQVHNTPRQVLSHQ